MNSTKKKVKSRSIATRLYRAILLRYHMRQQDWSEQPSTFALVLISLIHSVSNRIDLQSYARVNCRSHLVCIFYGWGVLRFSISHSMSCSRTAFFFNVPKIANLVRGLLGSKQFPRVSTQSRLDLLTLPFFFLDETISVFNQPSVNNTQKMNQN